MGLVPYIKTGAQHSADGMNDLYGALDGVLNTMSNNKSLYFMNGFSRYAEPQTYTPDAGMYGEQSDEFHFGLSHSKEERTSSSKKYYFLDGCKALHYTGECPRHWDGSSHEDGTPGPIDVDYTEYKSEEDCLRKHCGNYKNCTAEALIPAGEWGWWYKLIGQYGYGGEQQEQTPNTDITAMTLADEVGEINDYEKIIHPLMKAWEEEFFPIDVHPEKNLVLGIEHSVLSDEFSCETCNEGKWMDFVEDMCVPNSDPCEVIGQMNLYTSYIQCHFDRCPEGVGVETLHGSGSVWDLNFTRQIECDIPWGAPCPCSVKEIEAPYCTNLQHALYVPKMDDEFILYEFKYPKLVADAAEEDDDAGMGGTEPCDYCSDANWEFDINYGVDPGFTDQQGCYQFYCDSWGDFDCCNLADSSDEDSEDDDGTYTINKIIYPLKDARLISLSDATYYSQTLNRPDGPFGAGKPKKFATDELRFEHQGWCWDDNVDPKAYNDPTCENELKYAGKSPPRTPICDMGCFGFNWGCDMMPCPGVGCPAEGIPDHLPNLEHRFIPAELIFDGKREKYQKFKFSNEYNKFKFFRIHNLNNYDMEFEFEPDEELDEDVEFVSKGIFKKGEEKFVVGECSAGTGTKFKIPRHESRCVRRDWGVYATGYNNFQKFLAGDALYQLELSEAENVIASSYPNYYNYYDKTVAYIAYAKSNNIVNPFVIDDYIKKFQGRFQMDPAGPRTWDSSGLYIGAGQKIATAKDVATKPTQHWDPNLETPTDPGDVMGEFPGTRSYEGVGRMSMSGYHNGAYGRSSYALMTQPSHTNFYQGTTSFSLEDLEAIANTCLGAGDVVQCIADELYLDVQDVIEAAGECIDNIVGGGGSWADLAGCAQAALDAGAGRPRVALDNKSSVVADFLYHTGWVLQTTNIKSGMGQTLCPSCVEKKLIPYRGARLVHDFINNMNVNVLPVDPAYMHTINRGDYGLSGFAAAPFAFFDVSVHFNKENDFGAPWPSVGEDDDPPDDDEMEAVVALNPAALDGGPGNKGWKGSQGTPSYTSAYGLMLAFDPVNDPGYSGVGPIKSTMSDYDSDRLGPKHLRYVRHHVHSPNSGDWVKTVGKQFGFWGELKGRGKWTKDKLDERQTLACSGLQEDIRDDWFERVRVAEIGFANPPLAGRSKKGYSFEVVCGDGESLGFETEQDCNDVVGQELLTLPTVYVLADDDECEGDDCVDALEEAVKECTKWNRKRGIKEDCVEENIDEDSLVEKPNVNTPGGPGHYNYGSVWTTPPFQIPPWANDNIDPYAYSIHQMAISTNILGQNSWNHLKGQLYPVASIHEERASADQCMAPPQQILNSHIDFINTHDVKIGSYFYANLPRPFGTKNLYLAMQGYEISTSAQPLPYCYPLKRNPLGGGGSLSQGDNIVVGNWGGTEGHCWGRTFSDTSDFDMSETQRSPFEDCPTWTNMGAAMTLGMYNPRLHDGEPLPGGGSSRLVEFPFANSDMFKDSCDAAEWDKDWGVPFNGVVNHKLEPQCPWKIDDEVDGVENSWERRGKVELSSVAGKFVDEEWRVKIGNDQKYFSADWVWPSDGGPEYPTNETNIAILPIAQYAVVGGNNTANGPELELFVDGEAKFDYAETVDAGAHTVEEIPNENNVLKAAHEYKYSFWHALPRSHLIYDGHFRGQYNKYSKVGFDCTLANMFDKDWLSCGLPAGWHSHETQEPMDGYPWILWPTAAEYDPYSNYGLFMPGLIPFIKSHVIPISGGYVQDVPITEWRDDRYMPLVFKHDYSKVGEDHSYYGYIDFDEDGEGINKAKTSFEARRDMFSMSLGDIHEGLKEFNKYDGTHGGGGYWTGYTGVAPIDPTLAGDNANDAAMLEGWDGSEREGPHNGAPYLERRFMVGIEPMPIRGSSDPLETYNTHYESCCVGHCEGSFADLKPTEEWAEANEDKVTDGCSPAAELPCFYLSEKFCREGELAAGRCGTFYFEDYHPDLEPEVRTKRTAAMKRGCGEQAEILAGRKYETITAMSPPGGFETEDSFNYGKLEEGESFTTTDKISESSYKSEFFDNSASLNNWPIDYESNDDYDDANEMFYKELHKMYLEDGDPDTDLGNPFDGNYMKPVYGEYGKFSYSWQKNLNLRYKFSENFQSWGSDHMGRVRSYEGAYDKSYQISKAVGVGYDEEQTKLEESTSPILYSRYYRPIASNRTTFGGIMAELIFPPDKYGPSLIQLTNTRLHKDESAEHYGMGAEAFSLDTAGTLQHSMSWFWNTNRVKASWSELEPHCDSEFFQPLFVAGPNLGPPGGALYGPTGIIWNHPDLYLQEARKEHIISEFKGDIPLEEKNIIGFHQEYSPIDEKFRLGRSHTQCRDSMPAGNRYMPFTDIEGPTSITWDKHLSDYGPPRRAYEITGVAVPKDKDGVPEIEGYWPACMAVYYAQDYIIKKDNDRVSADDCMKKFFGASVGFASDGLELTSHDFIAYWLQYEDYCPTLKFSRWNGGTPQDYYSPKFWRNAEPCRDCGGDKWKLHKDQDDKQIYSAEWECRAKIDQACNACDEEEWKTYEKENGEKVFDFPDNPYAGWITCRIAACAGFTHETEGGEVGVLEEGCCPRCNPSIIFGVDDVDAYREMDIVPSGFPNINCDGKVDDIRLFEVVDDTMHKNHDDEYTTYDECQSCEYKWDYGSHDSKKGRWGSGGVIKGGGYAPAIEDLKKKNSDAPDLRSDIMYRPAGIPHFYDYEPIMTLVPPKKWPPPFVDADWEAMSAAIGCEKKMVRPDEIINVFPSSPLETRLSPLVMEHWTGVAWTSGACDPEEGSYTGPGDAGGSSAGGEVPTMSDAFLDASHAEIQDYWMAERVCADHTAPCAGFDLAGIRTIEEYGGQRPYFPAPLYSTKFFGRTLGRTCEQRMTWQHTHNLITEADWMAAPSNQPGPGGGAEEGGEKIKLTWPLPGGRTPSQHIGYRDPNWYGNQADTYGGHGGTDVAFHAPPGTSLSPAPQSMWDDMIADPVSVHAAAPGTVIIAIDVYEDQCNSLDPDDEVHGDGGTKCSSFDKPNEVIIDHGVTNVGYRYTSYLHLAKGSVSEAGIQEGQAVARGQKIGVVASAGFSAGPHLHFAVGNFVFAAPYGVSYLTNSEDPGPHTTVDPFNTDLNLSMWEDQCSLPIYNIDGQTEPKPPECGNFAGVGGESEKPKLSWPVSSNGPELNALSFFNPNWYGNSTHTYGGHDGTDIAHIGAGNVNDDPIPATWYHPDVDIVAAAPGKVVAVHDGEGDMCNASSNDGAGNFNTDDCGPGASDGKSYAGNFVIIDHDPNDSLDLINTIGYRYTSYSHMQKNSIVVAIGDTVERGQKVGKMGSSGNTSGPHLHFGVGTGPGGDNECPGCLVGAKDPFNVNINLSLWVDQCALPIYDLYPADGSGHGGLPVPPECT